MAPGSDSRSHSSVTCSRSCATCAAPRRPVRCSRSERRRYIGRMLLGAALAGVALLGTWGSLQWAPKWAIALASHLPAEQRPLPCQRVHANRARLRRNCRHAHRRLGRRADRPSHHVRTAVPRVVRFADLHVSGKRRVRHRRCSSRSFVAGGTTAAFYGWFPLYLPELFPTSIRATCQGFAYNFGRVLSAIGSLQTATLTAYFAAGRASQPHRDRRVSQRRRHARRHLHSRHLSHLARPGNQRPTVAIMTSAV